MGGRGTIKTTDRWAWVQELSDYRLERYGFMSMHHYKQGNDDVRKGAFNYELSHEYERRHGVKPSWG